MNNKVDMQTRIHFRDWLRQELRNLDFYQRRGDHYLIREFAKYCAEQQSPIDEASLGRYLRDDEPVLPTPERCRALARVLDYPPVQVLIQAGYLEGEDLFKPLSKNLKADEIAKQLVSRQQLIKQVTGSDQLTQLLEPVVQQMSQTADEALGSVTARKDYSTVRKELQKIQGNKSENGPAASAADALDRLHEAETQIRAKAPAGNGRA